MAGLSKTKNLSERDLNLKTSLQKLYRPGIENDIELFSLSSTISSSIISGPEILSLGDLLSQIYAIKSEKILVNRAGQNITLDRTLFKTRYFTFTNDNLVYFSKFNLVPGGGEFVTPPVYSNNGSIPSARILYEGRGFYFTSSTREVFDTSSEVTLDNVIVKGRSTGSSTARAKVVFEREDYSFLDSEDQQQEFAGYTPGSRYRYRIKTLEITAPGIGYLIPEELVLQENTLYNVRDPEEGDPTAVYLGKHRGTIFPYTDPVIKSQLYFYRVTSATSDGFFLFDDINQKYLYLDLDLTQLNNSALELKREDFIKVENLLQFKFAGSRIYLNSYGDLYFAGESLSGELNRLAANVDNNYSSVRLAIQNTKKPTLAESQENSLGYVYNEFVGKSIVIWQRVIVRDQDYLLDPGSGVTGELLKDSVENFELNISGNRIKVPGLFIKVGNKYFRAFSTTDKPFYQSGNFTSIENPKLTISDSNNNYGVLSAESKLGGVWYSYNTKIAELAQRIDPLGVNGAFYFHRQTAPIPRAISITKGSSTTPVNIYAVPLFTAV